MSAPKLFRPLDLVAPWLVCLLATGLCIYGAIVAKPISAKVVSAVTGAVFLAGIALWYWIRWDYIRHDFQTLHGLFIRCGKINRPDKQLIEFWTEELMEFWSHSELAKVYMLAPSDIGRVIAGVWITFSDLEKVEVNRPGGIRGFVVGFARGTNIVICLPKVGPAEIGKIRKLEEEAIHALFKHELSHVIVEKQAQISGEEEHHRIFRDNKLGA